MRPVLFRSGRDGYTSRMSSESPFGHAPSQEHSEKKDPRQEAADTLFEIRATKHLHEDDWKSHDQERDAMGAVLSMEVSQKLGEPYKVGEEENGFYLAQRENASSGWDFDPKDTLGIFTEEELDLANGVVRVSYDIRSMSKEHNGWSPRYFDTPMYEGARIEFRATSEARQRAYDVLEKDYQEQLKRYEYEQKDFQEFKAWADVNLKKSFPASEWGKYPLLEKLFIGVACKTFYVYRGELADEHEEYSVVFLGDDEQVIDIISRKSPQRPERSFPPMRIEK